MDPTTSTGDASASLATAKGIAQTLGQLVSGVQRNALTIGNVIAINNIGTSLIQVLPAPPATTPIAWILFHNPSQQTQLLVAPSSLSGVSFTTPGGGFLLQPGDYLPLIGNVSYAWSAIANAGTNQPLTIVTSTL